MRRLEEGVMASSAIWPTIHSEREALAKDLESLTDAQWTTGSLCDGWTVRDVLAHMTATAKLNAPAFFGRMITSGFSLTKVQEKDIAVERGTTPAETLERFEAEMSSTKHPPGPLDTWLGETIVHSQDIRRPLGIQYEYPTDAVVRAADFYKGSNLIIGAKKRIAGLQLRATDTGWSHGSGPEVSGPILSLVMAMTGRKQVLGDLSGDGAATLSSRP
jgi:uncharacterized protein (TIGR03083 family)